MYIHRPYTVKVYDSFTRHMRPLKVTGKMRNGKLRWVVCDGSKKPWGVKANRLARLYRRTKTKIGRW